MIAAHGEFTDGVSQVASNHYHGFVFCGTLFVFLLDRPLSRVLIQIDLKPWALEVLAATVQRTVGRQ